MVLANRIQTYDDFFDRETFAEIRDIAYGDNLRWKTQVANEAYSRNSRFQMGDMIREKNDWMVVGEHPFFKETLYNSIQKVLPDTYSTTRIYFNGYKPGVDGCLHVDGVDLTALLYVSDYDKEFGGFTHFYENDLDQMFVPPLPNRLVIFESDILHKGFGYSHQWHPHRITLAFKLKKHYNKEKDS